MRCGQISDTIYFNVENHVLRAWSEKKGSAWKKFSELPVPGAAALSEESGIGEIQKAIPPQPLFNAE